MSTVPVSALDSPGLRYSGTVAHAISQALLRHGVRTVFGQSLPTLLHLANAQAGIRQLGYRTENAGGCMADGFARVSGRAAVVTAQNGPAATLLVAPLAEALKASVAVVALLQDVNRDQTDKNAFQELDHLQLFQGCAKWVRRVTDASRVEDYIDQAFTAACSGRAGPAVLMLPADLLVEPAKPSTRKADLGAFPLDRVQADPARINEAARLLAEARAPLVVAGGGVLLSQAHDALAKLQELAALPVATSVMGKGSVAETHALSLGVIGYFMGKNSATHHLRSLVDEADVILFVGNRTNQNGTDSWTLFPKSARFVHLDVDGAEVGRNYESLRLVGDAKLTLEALAQALQPMDLSRRRAARPALEARIRTGKQAYAEESAKVRESDKTPLRPERVMHALQKRLDSTTIVVGDASYSSIWIGNCLTALAPGMRLITPRGLAGIGWGVPMAIGAKLAAPSRRVVALTGDGGFAHCWAELETLVRENIDISIIVLNNGILGYQKHAENVKFGDHTNVVHFAPVDHAAIARACGVEGLRVQSAAELDAGLARAFEKPGPVLLDVVTDADAYPPITAFEPKR
jgi:acetolactate synthase-1/2/3 large subunit